MSESEPRVPVYSWCALALLTAVYVLNFLDRTLIYILFPPIKKEMLLSDLQLALLGTTSFVIFYTLLGVPFGMLADRTSRKMMIGIGLAIWSLFSGLTGFAHDFWTLFGCRLMVGVGEATLGPAALSLLSDYFPPRMRATAQSIYASGIAIGGGLAFFLGGWIGQSYGWRWAFYFLGFPGLALAALVFTLREHNEERVRASAQPAPSPNALFRSVPYICLCAGYAFLGLASNNLVIWGPAFFVRMHGFSLMTIGMAGGVISVVVGIPSLIFAGLISDRLRQRTTFTSAVGLISVPLWIALLFVNNVVLLVATNVLLYALAITWVGPATADVTEIAGPRLRGLAIGVLFSAVNVAAYGIGSPLIGKLSDVLGLRNALFVCPLSCAIGAVLLWVGGRLRESSR